MIPDFGKAMSALADADSRLEQVANQQKITNGLLALLVLGQANLKGTNASIGGPLLSEPERVACIALARTAFNDRS